ncbi:hypothetical protein SYNTR_1871 [Candidatus Syntrophocurvum alkaliphilum]|uniref:Polymerase nucleotidyl transferase domain-containing protein n=1 Tax=Candidatus Syntrophocurvum alkaliphilum TaxID=2293317 RepID=A0A6I6DCT9_9FIRM|nr:nucleotidyltransferase domain-containing protein [Candidatus Syntrophocurvum alkaliphilum]QGU00465.1 hypothetical protein SYNTR_1871 [Candidatus Syntrophocurvum alkaliphilum]
MESIEMNNINKREERLNKVKHIVCSLFKGRKVDIYLIGSWAKGEEKRTSDIDIGIICHELLEEGFIAGIIEELEQTDIPYRIELVDLTEMNEDKRNAFLKGAVKWKDSSNGY